MKRMWESAAEIFVLQVALASATFFPNRERCLKVGNFLPPIKSKKLIPVFFNEF